MKTLLKIQGLLLLILLFTNCEKENNPPYFEGVEEVYNLTVSNNMEAKLIVADFKTLVKDPDSDPIFFEVESDRFEIERENGILKVLNFGRRHDTVQLVNKVKQLVFY